MRPKQSGLFWAVTILTISVFAAPAFGGDPCIDCHEKKTPAIVDFWKKSAHSVRNVGCTGCHGEDIEANHARRVTVDAERCGSCHKRALSEHKLSKHAIGLKAGKGCTRNIEKPGASDANCSLCHKPGSAEPLFNVECAMFLAQTPEMQRQGCTQCHMVEVRCDTCHTKHGTDLSLARAPGTCGVCHMGPDHPQYEMWELSPHGVIYSHGDKVSAPSCVTCHMAGDSHNVSRGISSGLPKDASGQKIKEREFMIDICARCHTRSLAARNLDDADRIEEQGKALVLEAQRIIEDLQKEGLLVPAPEKRPPHPLFDSFVIGPHMLYEHLSLVESLFFKMSKFYYITSYKGVFHQNPDYAHWYGNAPLKLTLSEIKSEAALLRDLATLKKRLDNLSPAIGTGEADELKKKLRELTEKRLKGELSEKEYMEMKDRLLRQRGL